MPSDTMQVLAGNTEHTPLYYLMAGLWGRWFDGSIAAIRGLSAIFSILAFPCMYWLCQELFRLPSVSGVATALFAVSPFYVLFAQEARPYSLLTLVILLSSAALLKALRQPTRLNWLLYTLTLMMGLYSHWFFTLLLITHGIYVMCCERLRFTKNAIAYLWASAGGIIAFLPWITLIHIAVF